MLGQIPHLLLLSSNGEVRSGLNLEDPVFINTLGYVSGLVLFAVLTFLVLKGWNRGSERSRAASFIASLLVFFWNAGSLVGLALAQQFGFTPEWLVAVNDSTLSALPAILFAIVVKEREPVLVRLGYLISSCSVVLHFAELVFPSSKLHEIALQMITLGFGALVVAAAIGAARRRDSAISIAGLVSLFLFAMSFLHFVYGHTRTSWRDEVAWHHAGIPLALIVLLRDYRFLLAETYLRFLANLGLAGIWAVCAYWAIDSGHLLDRAKNNNFLAALLLMAFCCSLVVFAYLRSLVDKRLTRTVFRRGDLNACSTQILNAASDSESEQQLLQTSVALMATFVGAGRYAVADIHNARQNPWVEVETPLRFSRGDSKTLLFGPRGGGRRYLQEDVESLEKLAALLVEQVERFRTSELQRLAQAAEFKALQAQVNPHFLFNALNTLYGTISRESFEARRLVLNLADLFRYSLQRDRTFISLGEEIEIVQAYLEVEKLRLQDRLSFEVFADPKTRHLLIPVLSVQPIVENAVKHGISKLSAKGRITVLANESNGVLQVVVEDNGHGIDPTSGTGGLGIGLENLRQRLQLSYGDRAELQIVSTPNGCCVTLLIPAGRLTPVAREPAVSGVNNDSLV